MAESVGSRFVRYSGPTGMNAVNCIKGEIHNVLAVMRANRRWASGVRFKREIPLQNESPLMRSFKTLHKHLETLDDLSEVDTVRYLQPFLDVIKSVYTTGPMTGAALAAINKFLLYNFIQPESIRAKEAINQIAIAVFRCRFEATEHESDEMVIMKLLEMSEYALRSSVGYLITGENVWAMVETVHTISQQPIASMLLQKSAENTLAHIVLTLFSRISEFKPLEEGERAPATTLLGSGAAHKKLKAPAAERVERQVGDRQIREDGDDMGQAPGSALELERASHHSSASMHSLGTLEQIPVVYPEDPLAASEQYKEESKGKREDFEGSNISSPPPPLPSAASSTGQIPVLPPGAENAVLGKIRRQSQEFGDLASYGIPLLQRVLEFLSNLVSPVSRDESARVLGLSLINIVLETAGAELGKHRALVQVLQGDLCKYLLQNSQTEDLTVLSLTLRVVFNLFNSIKHHLKVQLEVFFTSVHMRIVDSPSCSNEQKELAMESLLEFCREPALMLDLYINYDCDVHCTNLFESLCRALAKHSNPEPGLPLNVLNLLAFEGLRAIIESIASRCPLGQEGEGARLAIGPWSPPADDDTENLNPALISEALRLDMPGPGLDSESDSEVDGDSHFWMETARERTAEILHRRKRIKKRLFMAAEAFNTDRKGWIAYVQQLGLLPDPVDAESVARFLLYTPGLDKTIVGDYICEGPPEKYRFQEEVRNAYVKLFDFRGLTIDNALRLFLERFRLPGEAQKIDRIMEAFSKHLYEQSPDSPLANADAAFVLSFSIIMLNTDLHSAQVTKKMTVEEFVRNNRGINNGQDLPLEFLTALYEGIKGDEIKMRNDAKDIEKGLQADAQWDGVLKRRSHVVDASFTSNAIIKQFRAGLHEREMFSILFDSAVLPSTVVYEKTSDDATVQKSSETFLHLCTIAVYYQHCEAVNQLVIALARLFFKNAPALVQDLQQGGGVVAERDKTGEKEVGLFANRANRALWTLQSLYGLGQKFGDYIREGWRNLVDVMLHLNELDALPDTLVEMDDFVDSQGVPLPSEHLDGRGNAQDSVSRVRSRSRRRAQELAAKKAEEGLGLWSSLSTFLWSEYQEEQMNHVAKVKAALREAVEKAQIVTVFTKTRHLNSASLVELIKALILARDPTRRVDNIETAESEAMKEENAVLALEITSNIVLANHHRLEELWPLVHSYFERTLQSKDVVMDLLTERIVVNLLRICIRLLHNEGAQKPLLASLQLLQRLRGDMPGDVIDRVAAGLLTMLRANASAIKDPQCWASIFGVLGTAARHPNGRNSILEALEYLVDSGTVTVLNFQPCLDLLLRYIQEFQAGIGSRRDRPASQVVTGSANELQAVKAIRVLQALAFKISNQPPIGNFNGTVTSNPDHESNVKDIALDECWLSILRTLFTFLEDEREAVARASWGSLQNCFLLPGRNLSPTAWKRAFDEILFKLPCKQRNSESVEDIRLRNSSLLTKAFLHNIQSLAALPAFHLFWLQMLKRMGADLRAESSVLQETTLQALNNILNVMRADGIFDAVAKRNNQDLWEMTWAILDTVSPDVRDQVVNPMLEGNTELSSRPPVPAASPNLEAETRKEDTKPKMHSPPASQTSQEANNMETSRPPEAYSYSTVIVQEIAAEPMRSSHPALQAPPPLPPPPNSGPPPPPFPPPPTAVFNPTEAPPPYNPSSSQFLPSQGKARPPPPSYDSSMSSESH